MNNHQQNAKDKIILNCSGFSDTGHYTVQGCSNKPWLPNS